MSSRAPLIDVAASLATFAAGDHIQLYQAADGPVKILKLQADLDRYRKVIEATRPDVIIETGSRHGGSALFFADCGVQHVISIDIYSKPRPQSDRITWITGDSADPDVAADVDGLIAFGQKVMVALDSEHCAPHVKREIDLYGPMVSKGQYLVVEDTIFAYSPEGQLAELTLQSLIEFGTPMDAVEQLLIGNPQWQRDEDIERLSPTAHSPLGWWRRV